MHEPNGGNEGMGGRGQRRDEREKKKRHLYDVCVSGKEIKRK
jgi:hypothetical protein